MTKPLARQMYTNAQDAKTITLLTWNVLADKLAFGNFLHAPDECLQWRSRSERILAAIDDGLDGPPDVICLQEVDHFAFFEEQLGARGYAGTFAPKAQGRDGCCLFARTDRFTFRDVATLRYQDEDGTPHTQLALLATLAPSNGGTPLRVASTHLKAREGNEAIRAAQARQLIEALAEHKGPVLLGGDFNDTPESPAYQITSAALQSAYVGVLGSEAAWTTWKVREAGEKRRTIDYIWHSPDLTPVDCLEVPPDASVEPGRLPSWQYPSDHLSLVARFQLA